MTNSSTVASAYEGDFGWVWVDSEWVMARVCDDMLATYPADYLTKYFDLNEQTLALPWYSISRPPHDGNEKEPMHVTIRDKGMSMTVSLNLPDEKELRDRFFREVSSAAREFGK